MKNDRIISTLEDFGENLKKDLQESLRKKVTFGGNDSKLSNRIRFQIINTNSGVSFQLLMPEYGFAVDGGRRAAPVSAHGQASILDWVKRKGIVGKFMTQNLAKRKEKQSKTSKVKLKKLPFDKASKQLSFLIARKIHRKGFEGNNFFSSIVNPEYNKALTKELSEIFKKEVKIQLIRK